MNCTGGLLLLLIGTGLALYLFMMYSPLGHGATDQGVMNALDVKARAEAIKGNANHRNGEYEELMGE
jgi:hypothetical protein